MNEGIQKFLNMQKKLCVDTVKTLGYQHAKNLVGIPQTFDDGPVNEISAAIVRGRRYTRAMEYGCGIGRLIRAVHPHCDCVDGMDMSLEMMKYANQFLDEHEVPKDKYTLQECNGYSLSGVPTFMYDLVYSVFVFQHICVHEIRLNLMREFYRVLVPDGELFIQLNAGLDFNNDVQGTRWHQNYYSAPSTNSTWDVKLENPLFIVDELIQIGFRYPSLQFAPLPPNSTLANAEYMVYIRAIK